MTYDPKIHHRRSLRLRGYDYSQPGNYYVTLCTQDKKHWFGEIVEGEMRRNALGDDVARCWLWLAERYPYVTLDEWVVMPNHLHGIIVITGETGGVPTGLSAPSHGGSGSTGGSRTAPTKRKTLGRLVGAFKTLSTGRANQTPGTPAARLWQRDFYEHIIRNPDELENIREYIRTNPLRWLSDVDYT